MQTSVKPCYGWRVWGLGIVALGLVSLVLGDFDPGQPVPAWFPDRSLLAYTADGFMIIAGLAVQWRRATARAVAALTTYYLILVVIVMDGRIMISHPAIYGTYEAIAEQLAIASAGFIVCTGIATLDPRQAALLARVGQAVFGICAIVFGGSHFVYMSLTAPLVPEWLPPSQLFWGYVTGVAHIAAGIAILTTMQARLAAILLTIMFAIFTLLVHLPLLISAPHNPFFWTENALNLALIGSAWIVADSVSARRKAVPRIH